MSAVPRRITGFPRAVAAGSRRTYDRIPLRVKLVAIVLLLVIAALSAAAIAATTTLQHYLVGRVDNELSSVQKPIGEHQSGTSILGGRDGRGGRGGDGGRGPTDLNGLPSAYVVEVTNAAGTRIYGPTSSLADPGQPLPRLPHFTGAESTASDNRTLTVDAVRGGDTWRVLAMPVQLTNGTTGTLLIARSLKDVQSTVDRLAGLSLVIGAVVVVVLAGVGYLVVRASLRPLREVERTAAQIAGGDLSHRVPDADPRTEVGQLSSALNTMLGRIETAFAQRAASEAAARTSEEHMRQSEAAARRSEERMRRFIADASHELRTPLTSIRGFAELYRQGAAAGEADIRRLMSRIEGDAERMGLLVEDLLLLARLDQERPLAEVPVDLLALANDAVHDAMAIAPDRTITLEVGNTDPPPVVIGDEPRLRQVVANLVNNALKHTPPEAHVTIGIATGTGERSGAPVVVLSVADDGPGMTAEAAARVFERFYRADAARSRAEGSTGLGLAIVAALVAGHRGTVQVDTAPGAGARFRVELPHADVVAVTAVTGPGTD